MAISAGRCCPKMRAGKLSRGGETPVTKPEDQEGKQPAAQQGQSSGKGDGVPLVEPVYVDHQVVIIQTAPRGVMAPFLKDNEVLSGIEWINLAQVED
jgi:hypothetical protein